jgi:hypothetical protein
MIIGPLKFRVFCGGMGTGVVGMVMVGFESFRKDGRVDHPALGGLAVIGTGRGVVDLGHHLKPG